jgi:hypothetical protein
MNKLFTIVFCFLPCIAFAQADSIEAHQKKFLEEHARNDFIILNWSWDIDKSSQITVEASIVNPYEKDIKAMWLTFSVFDGKGKPVKDLKTNKTTVVIESTRLHPGNGGYIDYKFKKMFNSKSVEEISVELVKLQFADGSVKEIKGSKAVGEMLLGK